MTNLLNKLSDKFQSIVEDFKLTEVFFVDGELYTTSEYDLPQHNFDAIELELQPFNA